MDDNKQWLKLQRKVEKWVENTDPSVVVLYLPKPTRRNPYPQLKTVGSERLKSFIGNEDVRKAFVDSVRTMPLSLTCKDFSIKEDMPQMDMSVLEASMGWKRAKLSELVKIYMMKKKTMTAGYWGVEELKPEFWPQNLPFRPPTTNKAVNDRILNREEMDDIFISYTAWRKGQLSSVSQHDNSSTTGSRADEREPSEDNSQQESTHGHKRKAEKVDEHENSSTMGSRADEREPSEDNSQQESTHGHKRKAEKVDEHENSSTMGSRADKREPSEDNSQQESTHGHKRKAEKVDETDHVAEEHERKKREFVQSKRCEELEESLEEHFLEELKKKVEVGGQNSSFLTVKKGGVRYHVGGEVLQGRDLRTLTAGNWLNDKVINAYMSLLQTEVNSAERDHIYVLPSYLAVLWGNGKYDTWFYRNVHFSVFKWIFLPINKNQNHWILLAINVPGKQVHVLDSMGGKNLKFVKQWRTFITLRSKEVDEFCDIEWERGEICSSKQMDGNSCGSFVLMNALALTKDIPPHALSHNCSTVMRQYVLAMLTSSASRPPAQRTVCDMPGCSKPHKQMWVQCNVCGRWLHFSCVNLQKKPGSEYVCTICHAQYE